MKTDLKKLKKLISPIAEKYDLEAVHLFGLQARNEAHSDSDYDFYVKRGKLRGMFQLSGLFIDLKNTLNKEVDIVLAPIGNETIDDFLIEGIQKDGMLLYGK